MTPQKVQDRNRFSASQTDRRTDRQTDRHPKTCKALRRARHVAKCKSFRSNKEQSANAFAYFLVPTCRVNAGVNFQTSTDDGAALGRYVARLVLKGFNQAVQNLLN
jgi:hypothetical protein